MMRVQFACSIRWDQIEEEMGRTTVTEKADMDLSLITPSSVPLSPNPGP